MAIRVSQIESLREKLEVMPQVEDPDRKVSKMEAVRMMASSIRDLQSRGYSIEKIAEILGDSGLDIAPTTLKSYLTKVKGSLGKSNYRTNSKPRGQSNGASRGEVKKASEKPASAVSTKPANTKNIPTGVTPVASSSFKPKDDTDEI